MTLTSIIVLTWNSGAVVSAALRSVAEQSDPQWELILVDNCSQDETLEVARCEWAVRRPGQDLQVIALNENLGYAAGMNRGYAASAGEIVVPMNADATLHPDFVRRAREKLAERPEAGVLGALVMRWKPGSVTPWEAEDGPEVLDGGRIGLRFGLGVYLGTPNDIPQPAFKANGACPVIRKEVVESLISTYGVGPFDPAFDTYGEDIDFAFKVHRLGFETWFEPTLLAGHVRSHSSSRRLHHRTGRLRINGIAARWRNALRHLPAPMAAPTLLYLLAEDVGMCLERFARRDMRALTDVRSAWRRVWRERTDLRNFRSTYGTLTARDAKRAMSAGGRISRVNTASLDNP